MSSPKHRQPTVRWRKPKGQRTGSFRITYLGKRTEQLTPYETAREAEPERLRLEAALRAKFWEQGDRPSPGRRPKEWTLSDLLKEYSEKALDLSRVSEVYRESQIRRLEKIVGDIGPNFPAHLLGVAEIEAWTLKRLKEPSRRGSNRKEASKKEPPTISRTTVHTELQALRMMYRWATLRRLLPDPDAPGRPLLYNPWGEFRAPRPRTHREGLVIPPEAIKAMLDSVDLTVPMHRAVYLELHTGMREADLRALTWEAFDWSRGTLSVPIHKAREERTLVLPLPKAVAARMKELKKKDGRVCPWIGDTHTWHRVTKDLCGSRYSIKAFRHTFATGLVEGGVHPRVIKALMGHATDVTEGYSHPWIETLRKGLSALPWVQELGDSRGKRGRKRASASA